ncbi:hypothetical protein [Bremerella cremea]|uniref:hypothetical protein n=1 Tax=Bremerella cremea TaxID=1031537 RepID=UPI0031EC8834
MRYWFVITCLTLLCSGCAAIPEMREKPIFHNPFPQLARVAVIPFNNQSDIPTLDMDDVTLAYYGELQTIRGFEVVPIGVTMRAMQASGNNGTDIEQLRALGKMLGVDAIVVGSVTDYSPYYPKRMTLAVNWYATNPGFHPIPPGYGLPWGTADEEFIPESHLWEAEFALARAQLETQTPVQPDFGETPEKNARIDAEGLPPDWPDPSGFIPDAPKANRPMMMAQDSPIISQIRSYSENDSDFTERAEQYYFFLDDARNGGWQGFLDRSNDFIRFCCYSHITEMLSLRGGAGESQLAIRWGESR